jgi:hypothetical protein
MPFLKIVVSFVLIIVSFLTAYLPAMELETKEPETLSRLRNSVLNGPYGSKSIGPLFSEALENRGPSRHVMHLAIILRKDEALPELIERLKSESDGEAYNVLMLIQSKLRWRETLPIILDMLTDEKQGEQVRGRAATAAALFEAKEALPAIRDLLKTAKDPLARQTALMALGYLQDRGSQRLMRTYLDDDSEYVRLRAAMVLGMIGDSSGEAVALELSKHEKFGIRCTAAKALKEIAGNPSLTRLNQMALQDTSPTVRSECLEHLALLEIENLSRKEAVAKLKEILDPAKPKPPRWAFQYLVERFGSDTRPFLRKLAETSGSLQRPAAIALIYLDSDMTQLRHRGDNHDSQNIR